MSLVGTLAKVAIAVAAAKGLNHVIGRVTQSKSTGSQAQQAESGGLGGLLEQLTKGAAGSGSGTQASAPFNLDALI
jgi:hypothetical protein